MTDFKRKPLVAVIFSRPYPLFMRCVRDFCEEAGLKKLRGYDIWTTTSLEQHYKFINMDYSTRGGREGCMDKVRGYEFSDILFVDEISDDVLRHVIMGRVRP